MYFLYGNTFNAKTTRAVYPKRLNILPVMYMSAILPPSVFEINIPNPDKKYEVV